MRRRRPTDNRPPLRSSLADAAFAVEKRVVWGGAERLHAVWEIVKWPFERLVWAVERKLLWPLQKRTAGWDDARRAGSVAAMALLAAGAGVLGLILASGSGGGATATPARLTEAPLTPQVAQPAPREAPAKETPVLHGAPPEFVPEDGVGASKAVSTPPESEAADTVTSNTSSSTPSEADTTASASDSTTSAKVVAVGPAATKVAHRFAGAFVHFETGQVDGSVRRAFAATASPRLTRSLLRRPPRLPANVKVPRAKVLNVVPGPKRGNTYTLSVSLLRVGVTSELRIEMERDPGSGEWLVTDVLG